MDITKAFDSINHDSLLSVLFDLGIQKNAYNWFKSYLCNRKQYVEIAYYNEKKIKIHIQSQIRSIQHGVPQGSILGPLLYICYTGNLPKLTTCSQLIFYADDVNLKISGCSENEIESATKSDLGVLKKYFNDKQLLLNPDKTKFIYFSTRQTKTATNPKIEIDGKSISKVDHIKFLGLLIDNNLSWNLHAEKVISKTSSGIYALSRLKPFFDAESLKTVYFAYIHSIISFGISLYGATSISNLDAILKLQKKAIRIILNLKPRTSVKEHFSSLNIMTVYGIYVFETILSLKSKFNDLNLVGDNHNYSTRKRGDIALNSHRLQLYTKKPTYIGSKFYNKLPQHIRNAGGHTEFKRKLKQFLINKALYSLEEL
uniref:Reverse transcriptase domain-containing protein n=1 Tax=Cuerna arida TaxID=1464854 RepID=A0A1B6F213_9HEMI